MSYLAASYYPRSPAFQSEAPAKAPEVESFESTSNYTGSNSSKGRCNCLTKIFRSCFGTKGGEKEPLTLTSINSR